MMKAVELTIDDGASMHYDDLGSAGHDTLPLNLGSSDWWVGGLYCSRSYSYRAVTMQGSTKPAEGTGLFIDSDCVLRPSTTAYFAIRR